MSWWRAYDEAVDDPKLQRLPAELFRTWFNLCCLTNANKGTLPPLDVIAFKLRTTEAKVEKAIEALQDCGLIDTDEAGTRPHNWRKRQFKGDGSTDGRHGPEPYVYFIGSGWASPIKIGISKNPWARVGELQTGHDQKLEVLAAVKSSSNSEVDLHTLLTIYRRQGEWFDLPTDICSVVVSAVAEKKMTYEKLVERLRSKLLRTTTPETETETETEKIKPADAGGDAKRYSFDGGVIRLSLKHFQEWEKAFKNLDLRAELVARDAWLGSPRATDSDRSNWFISTSKYLANRNQEAAAKRAKPLTRAEELYREGLI